MENFRLFIAEQEKTEGSVGLKEQSLSTMKALAATAGTTRGGQPSATEKKKPRRFKDPYGKYGLYTARNFGRKRRSKDKITCIMIHESGTPRIAGLLATLKAKKLSVNWAVTSGKKEELVPTQHYTIHAPGYNRSSIGVEVNHNYYLGKNGENPINAPWHNKSKYGVPTEQTLEATYTLCMDLCSKWGIPFVIANLDGNKYDLAASKRAASGIVAHGAVQSNRSDGLFPCLYMALRQKGYPPSQARQQSIDLMTGVDKHKAPIVTIPEPGIASKPSEPTEKELASAQGDPPA